ncbi:MAG: tetratricopeptide repeat protein, partial [Cyanobacteria bacterium P01_D01_bin.44]
LASLGIRRYWWQETKLGLSLLLLFSLVGFRTSLPQISQTLTRLGTEDIDSGSIVEAETQLKRAISLDRDNADAHYQLAQVYDDLDQTDKAIIHYQIAAEEDIWVAYAALAELYIRDERTALADALIEEALIEIPETAETQPVRSQLSRLRVPEQPPEATPQEATPPSTAAPRYVVP